MTSITRRGAIATGIAAASIPRARAQTTPIRIGLVSDPNGVYADNGGMGNLYAARLAVEEIGGKLLGRPVEVMQGDCANKPDVGVGIAREWIDTQGVDVIVDGASSAVGLALQQVTRDKKRIYLPIGPATSDLTGSACSPYCIAVSYDTYALAKGTGSAVTKTRRQDLVSSSPPTTLSEKRCNGTRHASSRPRAARSSARSATRSARPTSPPTCSRRRPRAPT